MRSVAVRAVLVLAFTAALAVGPSSVARGGPAATDPGIAQTIVARSVATGLGFPAGFTFAPDGRIFYGERFTGELRVINPSTGTNRLFFTVPNLTSSGEQGLLAVALHPSYPSVPQVFLYATRLVAGSPHGQILRITNQGGTGTGLRVVRDLGVATQNHNGGRLLFGPDGKLYLSIGDRLNPANSQNLAVLPGKVLRLNPDGSVPADNPVAGNPLYAYGLRNSFGFDFDPQTGRLWLTDNGPACNDELDLIGRGRNHGWGPSQTCATPPAAPRNTNQDGPNPMLPRRFYNPPIAPTGAVFCASCGLGAANEGALFFGAWVTGEIRRVVLTANRLGVASQNVAYRHPSGVLGMEAGPAGQLHFSTQNAIYRLAFV